MGTLTPAASHDWKALAQYATVPFPPGWPDDRYSFFSPRDLHVEDAIADVLGWASHRVMVNIYGYDSERLDGILHAKAADENVAFLMNLDSSQAGGVHEKKILAAWAPLERTSVAIGRSIDHAISHLKVAVVDGLYVISGSTNWSLSGEAAQDNELIIQRNPLVAARYESVLLANHVAMLKQMGAAAA